MKKCTRCEKVKKLDDFSPNKKASFGKQSRCKTCNADLAREYRKNNPGLAAKRQAEYRKKHPEKIKAWYESKKHDEEFKEKRKLQKKRWIEKNPQWYSNWYWSNEKAREKKKAYHRRWLEENREYQKRAAKSHAEKYPEKVKARSLLRKAVYYGKIKKPCFCQLCKKEKNRIEGHHDDCSKPYDVTWLCVSCHRKTHIRS